MKNLLILTTLFLITQCEPVPTQSVAVNKKMVFDDFNYEEMVGMVQLLPTKNGQTSILENPVIALNDNEFLKLEFDLLTNKFEYLSVKLYHCNQDWSQSLLRDMEYLKEINVYRVTDFDNSLNTVRPYINYRIDLPKPTLSGNYIVSVFRRGNPKDVLFNRKFLVANNLATIEHQVRVSNTVSKRDHNQQIDFNISYGDLMVNNPTNDIKLTLLQNHRWYDAITELRPSLIRPNEGYMEFRLVDESNNFPGWNEFRFFDMRTLNVSGRNVGKISRENEKLSVQLGLDKPRVNEVYTQNLRDVNGNFIIQNTDPGDVPLNSDYANVNFVLESKPLNGNVYVAGRFNNWQFNGENIMRYDNTAGLYFTSIELKQGYYDYLYFVESQNEESYQIEGSYFQTENDYEILVYYRKPGNVYDELIGYKRFNSLP